jgi:GMP synthase-like glutamine amidotransferase
VRALVVQYGKDAGPGLLSEWAAERGIELDVVAAFAGDPVPDAAPYDFTVALGSERSVTDAATDPIVGGGLAATERAIADGTPVLGLCFGGQLLARALGAEVERTPLPETGWHEIESHDTDVVPAGPWVEWHYDRFAVPAGAQELARSASGPQAFRRGPHLGVQFHPEATPEIVLGWANKDHDRMRALHTTPERLLTTEPHVPDVARAAAFRFFDAFLANAGLTGDR